MTAEQYLKLSKLIQRQTSMIISSWPSHWAYNSRLLEFRQIVRISSSSPESGKRMADFF